MLILRRKRSQSASQGDHPPLKGFIVHESAQNVLPEIVPVEATSPQAFVDDLAAAGEHILADKDSPLPTLVLRELVRNLRHAEFKQPVVTISHDGRHLTVSDQGPGIADKARAVKVGYYGKSSGSLFMNVPRVGMGLPLVCRLLKPLGGELSITDNLGGGTVVLVRIPSPQSDIFNNPAAIEDGAVTTEKGAQPLPESQNAPTEEGLSRAKTESYSVPTAHEYDISPSPKDEPKPGWSGVQGPAVTEALSDLETKLSRRQRRVLFLVADLGYVGPSTASAELDMSISTAFRDLVILEQMDLVQSDENGKRSLTPLGARVIAALTA